MIQSTWQQNLNGNVVWYYRHLIETIICLEDLKISDCSEKAEIPYREAGRQIPAIEVNTNDVQMTDETG